MTTYEKDQYFLNLILQNKVYINEDSTKVIIEDIEKTFGKQNTRGDKNNYYYSIRHNGIFIMLHRLVIMYHTRKIIPEGMFINHIDGNKTNNKIENLEVVTNQENIQHAYKTGLNKISDKAKRMSSLRLQDNNPNQKLDKHKVEFYRCLYYSGKITKKAIAKQTNTSIKTVENFLRFKSFPYDPITGVYDIELTKLYDKESRVPNIYNKYTKSYSRIFTNISLLEVKKLHIAAFRDGISLSELSRKYNIHRESIRKYITVYDVLISMFPNHIFMKTSTVLEIYTKLLSIYKKTVHKFMRELRNINFGSYSIVLDKYFNTSDLKSIFEAYRDNKHTVTELSKMYKVNQSTICFAIIEYQRFHIKENEIKLTPEQFHYVFSFNRVLDECL